MSLTPLVRIFPTIANNVGPGSGIHADPSPSVAGKEYMLVLESSRHRTPYPVVGCPESKDTSAPNQETHGEVRFHEKGYQAIACSYPPHLPLEKIDSGACVTP